MEIIIKCSDENRGSKNIYGEPIQELVRCKDCIAYIPFKGEKGGVCTMHREYEHTFPDDYCSRGERKENAETD